MIFRKENILKSNWYFSDATTLEDINSKLICMHVHTYAYDVFKIEKNIFRENVYSIHRDGKEIRYGVLKFRCGKTDLCRMTCGTQTIHDIFQLKLSQVKPAESLVFIRKYCRNEKLPWYDSNNRCMWPTFYIRHF